MVKNRFVVEVGPDMTTVAVERGVVRVDGASIEGGHRVLRAGERIHEVPITYKARSREAGKKLTAVDGLRVLRTLVRCRVS